MKRSHLLILLIIALLAAGFTYYSSTSSVTDTSVSDEYLEYSNEEFGFSFMYPSDWELTEFTENDHVVSGWVVGVKVADTEQFIEDRRLPNDIKYNFVVSYWDDINNKYAQAGGGIDSRYDYKSLGEYLNDDVFRMVQLEGGTAVDGVQAYEVIVGGFGATYAVMFESDGLYQLLFSRHSDAHLNEEEKKVFNSFQLLESE
ncbi:hypothetical protein HOI18_02835 [Candidatus Uhrbacteria bacterium]|nr:hypothetical protein [Candidatus Uhrbacteria bacterium]